MSQQSRHEGVSCDACLKNNFRGRRYKCLTCYDYDLCAQCYESSASGQSHTPDHPMQCILTRADFSLYYGTSGNEYANNIAPQAFTCPFCARLGFSELTLQEHISIEHADAGQEVVCPVCAAMPRGDPNNMTEDLNAHLTLDHGGSHRDSTQEESVPQRTRQSAIRGRGFSSAASSAARTRRSNVSAGLAALSASASRPESDHVAELLSHIGGLPRNQSAASQIAQIQQAVSRGRVGGATRRGGSSGAAGASGAGGYGMFSLAAADNQYITIPTSTRVPIRTEVAGGSGGASGSIPQNITIGGDHQGITVQLAGAVAQGGTHTTVVAQNDPDAHRYLIPSLFDRILSLSEQEVLDKERKDRSLFVQELLLSSMTMMTTKENDNSSSDNNIAGRALFAQEQQLLSTVTDQRITKNTNKSNCEMQSTNNSIHKPWPAPTSTILSNVTVPTTNSTSNTTAVPNSSSIRTISTAADSTSEVRRVGSITRNTSNSGSCDTIAQNVTGL